MKLRLLIILFIISCTGNNHELSPHESAAKAIHDSLQSGSHVPLVSETNPSLQMKDAYVIQKHYVDLILGDNEIAGFKTGLASRKAQSELLVDSPISGVLFLSGKQGNNSEIKLYDYFTMLVETELGFIIKEDIKKPLKKTEELDKKISAILPVVELPDVRFENRSHSKLVDVVAANICSSKFIMGSEHDFKKYGSDNIDIKLKLDGNTINSVSITDSMDYQKELLLWLINKQLENGWKLNTGQVLITGAMNKINIGRVGDYDADYGHLGKVNFKVR